MATFISRRKRKLNEQEKLQHEATKIMIKLAIQYSYCLTPQQKQIAIERFDQAAQQADWFIEMMKRCGFVY